MGGRGIGVTRRVGMAILALALGPAALADPGTDQWAPLRRRTVEAIDLVRRSGVAARRHGPPAPAQARPRPSGAAEGGPQARPRRPEPRLGARGARGGGESPPGDEPAGDLVAIPLGVRFVADDPDEPVAARVLFRRLGIKGARPRRPAHDRLEIGDCRNESRDRPWAVEALRSTLSWPPRISLPMRPRRLDPIGVKR